MAPAAEARAPSRRLTTGALLFHGTAVCALSSPILDVAMAPARCGVGGEPTQLLSLFVSVYGGWLIAKIFAPDTTEGVRALTTWGAYTLLGLYGLLMMRRLEHHQITPVALADVLLVAAVVTFPPAMVGAGLAGRSGMARANE